MAAMVEGVIVDQSLLLLPEADTLLRQLRHSTIPTAISHGLALDPHSVQLLKDKYSLHCFVLDADDAINDQIVLAWRETGGTILYLASDNKNASFRKLIDNGWLVAALRVEGSSACGSSSVMYLNTLLELPLTICHLNKKAIGDSVVTVGYIMKPSREEDFAKRGAFPMRPTKNGLMFLPLTFELPLSSQLQEVDVLLHKATDEIMSVDLRSSLHSSNKITYSKGMQELQRYMEHHQDLCVIDPLNSIYPILDRLKIQEILLPLEDLKTGSCCVIRGPHYLKVDDFNQHGLTQMLSEAKLALPSIVKPQVACGVADAHSMAIVFRVEDFKGLNVPLPAIIQEYVDHASTLYKFYVLGDKAYHAVKRSTPNADALMTLSGSDEPKPLIFDSLKSLPTRKQNLNSAEANRSKGSEPCIDIELVTRAANFLTRKLELTIFGFDVVVQEGSGDHVIVDVNYLPSFKEVPNEVAIPAFWEAIKNKYEWKKKGVQAI